MAYTIGEDGLLDFSGCESDEEKEDQAWDYFCENLSDVEVVAFDGKLVRGFTEVSFSHIVSGSSNKWDTAMGHDIDFVERRARCLPLIGKVMAEVKDRYAILTAFPSNKEYYDRCIKGQGVNVGIWGEEK